MSRTVARRPKTRKRRGVDRQRRRAEQNRVQARIDVGIANLVQEAIEQALQDEVTRLLGRGKSERRDLADSTEVSARCNKCGVQYRRQFYRAGFYKRGLLSIEVWGMIRVPRVSCVCGGMVDVEFAVMSPYGRQWFEVEERARELAGLCVSLREAVEVLAWRNGQPLSIGTLNRMVNKTADLAEAWQAEELARVPAVVMLDGLWLKVLEPTGQHYLDSRGRRRQRHKKRKFPLLVAYGVDPASGERWLMDWERGRQEDQASWQKLLERLWARGLSEEGGLRLFIHDGAAGLEKAFEMVDFGRGVARQRCIFHKLQNVGQDVVGSKEMSRTERRQRRGEVLADATAVYWGENEEGIRQHLAEFRNKWQEEEPKAVATLERDFEQTLVYLKVQQQACQAGQVWPTQYLRATSALERIQRHFREKARQVVIFHSQKGIEAAILLVIMHRRLASRSTKHWARALEEALLAA